MRKILETLMESRGDNAYDISRSIGLHPGTIYRFLQGKSATLSGISVTKLAKLYGVTESQLRGDAPIEGTEITQPLPELKELLTLDEYRHIANIKSLSEESRAVIYKMAAMLAEPQAEYDKELPERRMGERRTGDTLPNEELRIGKKCHQAPPSKKRLKNDGQTDCFEQRNNRQIA